MLHKICLPSHESLDLMHRSNRKPIPNVQHVRALAESPVSALDGQMAIKAAQSVAAQVAWPALHAMVEGWLSP